MPTCIPLGLPVCLTDPACRLLVQYGDHYCLFNDAKSHCQICGRVLDPTKLKQPLGMGAGAGSTDAGDSASASVAEAASSSFGGEEVAQV